MKNLDDTQRIYLDIHFDNINLTNHEFIAKEFENCSFNHCNFSESFFNKCKFYECHFNHCNLSLIKIKGSTFFDTIFNQCKAIGINWTEATWPKIKLNSPIKFYQCVLNDSSFFGLSIREIVINECNAKEVDFREADCTESDFSYTDFANSQFGKTILTKANFTEAINYNIDIFNNQIRQAKFSLPEAANLLNCLDIQLID